MKTHAKRFFRAALVVGISSIFCRAVLADTAQAKLEKLNAQVSAATSTGRARHLAERGILYLFDLNESQKAVDDLTEALRLIGDRPGEAGLYRFVRGQAFIKLKQFKPARDDLLLAAQSRADDPSLWSKLAQAHFELGDYEEAVNSAQKAHQLDPTKYQAPTFDRDLARKNLDVVQRPGAGAYRSRADYFVARGRNADDFRAALADYDSAIIAAPETAELYALRARARFHALQNRMQPSSNPKAELRQVESDLARALELDPQFLGALYLRARLLMTQQEAMRSSGNASNAPPTELFADLDRVIALAPERGSAYYLRGRAERLKPQPDAQKLLDDYSKAIALEFSPVFELPGDQWWSQPAVSVEAHLMRGKILASRQQSEAAISALTVVILMLEPENQEAFFERGKAYLQNQQFHKALEDLRVSLAIKPIDPEALMLRARAYDQLGQYAWAQADLKQALRFAPKVQAQITGDRYKNLDAPLTNAPFAEVKVVAAALEQKNRGNELMQAQKPQEARAAYDKALEIDPNYADAYNNRGNTYKDQDEFLKAVSDYDKAIELKPYDYRFYGNRAVAYRGQKLWRRALADYTTAQQLAPQTPEANAAAAEYRAGMGAMQYYLKRYTDSVKSLERSRQLAPLAGKIHLLLAMEYSLTGEGEKARLATAESLQIATPEEIKANLQEARHIAAIRKEAINSNASLDTVYQTGDGPKFELDEFIKALEEKVAK